MLFWCGGAQVQRGGIDSLGCCKRKLRERRDVSDFPGKAPRVIPRGKQRLTVYRAQQVSQTSKYLQMFEDLPLRSYASTLHGSNPIERVRADLVGSRKRELARASQQK